MPLQNKFLRNKFSPATFEGKHLAIRRGGRWLFSDLHVQVNAGHALAICGANGVGKTSLLRMVAGLLPMAAGTLRLDNAPLVPQNCHYIGHNEALKNILTIDETLSFYHHIFGGIAYPHLCLSPDAARAAVGLAAYGARRVGELSAGQRRRLALARLLLGYRRIWLLDEPFASLDASARLWLQNLIAAHLQTGGLALIATHEPLPFAHDTITLKSDATHEARK